jgi:adenylate cyclase
MELKTIKLKMILRKSVFVLISWLLFTLYTMLFIRGMINLYCEEVKQYQTLGNSMLFNIIGTIIGCLCFCMAEFFIMKDKFRKKSFSFTIILKSLIYISIILAVFFLVFVIAFFYIENDFTFLNFVSERMINIGIFTNILNWGLIITATIIILQINDKFGQGVFLHFLLGKYHKPKIESRIFMFLDIKSSTTIAEELGHVKYFEFLNDFYSDITDSIIYSYGEIYQYIGDEIVVSWNLKMGINNQNSINCFFEIEKIIEKLSDKYLNKYKFVPEFKAGIHYGEVTTGEIGIIKKEIIFTGDVLNTTARIQAKCNSYNAKLLISSDMLKIISFNENYTLTELGEIELRGKQTKVGLIKVNLKSLNYGIW